MRTTNTMGIWEFIFNHILYLFIAIIWYKHIFRCLDNFTYKESKMVLTLLIALSIIIGFYIELRKRRNDFSVFVNIMIPYGIYTVLTYFQIKKLTIAIVLCTCSVLSILYALFVLNKRVRHKKKIKKIIKRKIEWIIASTQAIFATGFAIILGIMLIPQITENSLMHAKVEATINEEVDNERSIANNIESLVLLKDDVWKTLSVQKKLDILQMVANIEQRYLGTNELNVESSELEENVNAYYDDRTHKIVINLEHLLNDESWDVVKSVNHEAYHAYQHRLIEVYNEAKDENKKLRVFRNVGDYIKEFSDYNDGLRNFEGYYSQKCEEKARDYSESAVSDYYEKITKYIEETESKD